jgi:DNA topoisomerase IB
LEDSRALAVDEALPPPMLEAAAMAHANGLVYVVDSDPGIRRVRRGRSFAYVGPGGRPVTDSATLERIAKLAIPPAYEDVWICTNALGHLQATGRDARRRKQYRYHADWRVLRDSAKFQRMIEFGDALPKLRRRVRRDLARPGLPRERVLAAIVSLLDATWIRVGNAEYARDNDSYGLTTLRNRHVRFLRSGRLQFQFRAKGGVMHDVVVDDERLARIVRRCHQLPGQRLFQYVDDGAVHAVDSGQVNQYLRDVTGAAFTAKDFRTWGATLTAIDIMARTPRPERASERAQNGCIVAAVKEVASVLRNTPAVCRKSYINPVVFTGWRDGVLHEVVRAEGARTTSQRERRALAFLRRMARPKRARARADAADARRATRRRAGAAAQAIECATHVRFRSHGHDPRPRTRSRRRRAFRVDAQRPAPRH